jgi:glycosyltransferase involved in cell wall biosynthesis
MGLFPDNPDQAEDRVAAQQPPLARVRVGFFTSVIGMGGSEVLLADTMEAAAAAGAEVICWSHPDAAIRRILASRGRRIPATLLDWPARPTATQVSATEDNIKAQTRASRLWRRLAPAAVRRCAGFVNDARRFRSELRRIQPQLLLVNVNGSEAASLATWGLRDIESLNCYHLSVTPATGSPLTRIADWCLKAVSMWSAPLAIHVSAAARHQWCRLCRYPRRRTTIIFNGVDALAQPTLPSVRRELGIGDDQFVFCVPGRLDGIKGHRFLLDGVALIRQQLGDAKVLICGDGPLYEELRQHCSRAGTDAIVRFLGWRSDLKRILHESDCTVLPSVASENLSLAVLESLIVGTPAIVTAVGGMAEAVRHEQTGLVVPPASPVALAGAMQRMVSNRHWVRQLGAAAKADALTRFTRERMMTEYVSVLTTLSGRCRGKTADRGLVPADLEAMPRPLAEKTR